MLWQHRPEVFEIAADTLKTYLDRIPSANRKQVQGLAEFLAACGQVNARIVSLTAEAED